MTPKIDDLIADLHHPDPEVRIAAADALGQYPSLLPDYDPTAIIRARGAIPVLAEVLHTDPTRDVRKAAAYALGGLGDPAAVHTLSAALTTYAKDTGLRLVIVKALGKLGVEAVPALQPLLDDTESLCIQTATQRALERARG